MTRSTECVEAEIIGVGQELSELTREICNSCAGDVRSLTEELQLPIAIRIRSTFDAVLLLVQNGFAFESWPLVRAMLEWLFVASALARDGDHAADFIKQDLRSMAKLARGIDYAAKRGSPLSEDDRDVIERRILEAAGVVDVRVIEWANRADLLDRYETAYRYLSIRSHACVRQLDRLLYIDSEGRPTGYREVPMESEPRDVIRHAVAWLQDAVASLPQRWTSAYTHRAAALGARLQALFEERLPD